MKHYNLIAQALETRAQAYFEAKNRVSPDIRTAKTSLELFNPEYIEKGIALYTKATGIDAETLATILGITDEKNPKFIANKQLDKVVRLIQYLGGATAFNSNKPTAFREVMGNWEKGGRLRKGVIDSFVAIFASRVANLSKLPRDEKGHISGPRPEVAPSTQDLNDMFKFSRTDLKGMLNYNTFNDINLFDPERIEYEMSMGAGDFGDTTTPTQASQIRSFFIILGLAEGRKNEKTNHGESPKLKVNGKVAMMIAKAVKQSPIHPNTMANLNG